VGRLQGKTPQNGLVIKTKVEGGQGSVKGDDGMKPQDEGQSFRFMYCVMVNRSQVITKGDLLMSTPINHCGGPNLAIKGQSIGVHPDSV
jgi:hypothetical protein